MLSIDLREISQRQLFEIKQYINHCDLFSVYVLLLKCFKAGSMISSVKTSLQHTESVLMCQKPNPDWYENGNFLLLLF